MLVAPGFLVDDIERQASKFLVRPCHPCLRSPGLAPPPTLVLADELLPPPLTVQAPPVQYPITVIMNLDLI